MAYEEDGPDDEANVGGEEVGGLPLDEGGKPVRQQDEDAEKEAEPGEIGLEGRSIWQGAAAEDATVCECALKPQVADTNGRPAYEARDGRDVKQPAEHLAASRGQVEISE